MPTKIFEKTSDLSVSREDLSAWHLNRGAFERLTPPWTGAKLLVRPDPLVSGCEAVIGLPAGPFTMRWVAHHPEVTPGHSFRDEQVSGPFAAWDHRHIFEDIDRTGWSKLTDRISYRLPLSPLSDLVAGWFATKEIQRMFEYRHETTAGDLGWHQKYSQQKLRIAITGGTGLVGSELAAFLTTGGHEVIELGRRDSGSGNKWVKWDVESGVADPSALEGIDAVVHLAGENIADGRWTDKRKDAIVKSRVDGTRNLVASLTGLAKPPKTFVCASAIGIYGDSGDAVMTEDSPAAEDFLAGVCRNWESASRPAETAGIRVVNLRIGVVLTPEGGALKKTLLPFKLGAGGRLGSGRQYMSWIAIDDLVGAILHCIATEDLSGPVNATAPGPVTNAVYTKSLASILKRPAIAPAPAFVLRLALGEMADALLLSSTRVVPKKLEDSGFEFRYPQIDHALSHLLGA